MHLAGGGGGGGIRGTPVHRDPHIDELHYNSSGPDGNVFIHAPHGADRLGARLHQERNRAQDDYDLGDVVSAYTIKPLKGTSDSFKYVMPYSAG